MTASLRLLRNSLLRVGQQSRIRRLTFARGETLTPYRRRGTAASDKAVEG